MGTYYRKQTFSDGELVATSYIDQDGVEYTNFTPQASDIISVVPPPFLPRWREFNLAMFSNSGYNRVVQATTNQRETYSLVAVLSPAAYTGVSPDLALIKSLWDSIINGLAVLNKPTTAEVAQWNTIAQQNFVPFSFQSDGELLLG